MSLIVAVKDKDRVVIGCDTRMSSSVCYEDGYNERPKAIKLKNGMIVGCVGNVGLLDIFANKVNTLTKLDRETIVFKVYLPIIDKIRCTSYLVNNNELDGEIVLAYKDKAFAISEIGTVEEIFTHNAYGSGKMSALGSLLSTISDGTTAEEKIYKAITTTAKLVPSVSGEVWIGDTKDNDFEKYE